MTGVLSGQQFLSSHGTLWGRGGHSFHDESLSHLVFFRCASVSSGGSDLADLHSQYLIAHPGCLTHPSNASTSWICLFTR